MAIVLENAQGPADPVAAAAAALVEAAAADERKFTPGALHSLLAGALAPLAEGGDESAMTPQDHMARAGEHMEEAKKHEAAYNDHSEKALKFLRERDPASSRVHGDAAVEAHGKFVHHLIRHSHHVNEAIRKL